MVKNVVQEIGGIGIYGVVSICIFISVFSGAFLWACLQRQPFLARMSALPLEHEDEPAKGDHE